jgi:hypothetical protein
MVREGPESNCFKAETRPHQDSNIQNRMQKKAGLPAIFSTQANYLVGGLGATGVLGAAGAGTLLPEPFLLLDFVGVVLTAAGCFGGCGAVAAAAGVAMNGAHSKAPAKAAAVRLEVIFFTTNLPLRLNTVNFRALLVRTEGGHRHYSRPSFCCRSALDQIDPANRCAALVGIIQRDRFVRPMTAPIVS